MCEMSEERTYYIRTSLMYKDLTREVLFKVFKYLIKSDDITGFLSSLEQQNNLRELLQRHVLNKPDYNLVSSQVLNLERFDISLLVRLILNLCKDNIPQPQRGWETQLHPKDESLGADLLRLRDVRNKIIGHRADAKLSEAEYEKTWAKIKAILLRVVKLVDSKSSENFEQRIDEYKRLNVDIENAEVKRLLDELLNYKIEFDHLQEKVEELSIRSKEFQEYFKITPEIFVRYIKLLFDGGRIVLCGIMNTKLDAQNISDFLERKKETLITNIDEKFFRCLFSQDSCSDYKKWDVFLLASVLLLTCDNELSQKEIMYIERIKSARVNYAALALQSLDTVDFLTNWTDLIICLKDLSSNIAEDDKLQVEHLIERYKKKDEGGCDAEQYFKQLRESGVEVKTLNDVYNETIKELKDMLNQLSQKDFKFAKGYVLEFKLLTICENEEIKKEAEDLLEINLQASIQKSDQPSGSIRKETDKVVAIIAAHPDVTPIEVKRMCIIWSFKCFTPGGLLHILDVTNGDQLRSTFRNIAYEMHYIYGYAFLIQGKFTLESVSMVSRMINKSTTNEASTSIPLNCLSGDGISAVLSAIKQEKATNSLNRIAEQMSAEFNETVSIKLTPDLMEFRNVFEETDSEGSSSPCINEYEIEEWGPLEIDETDKEVARGRADDKNNEACAAQQLYDEKKMAYAIENKELKGKIKTITDTFQTINLGKNRIKDVIVGDKRTENELDETEKEKVRGNAYEEENDMSVAQQLFDEKMKENKEPEEGNIKTITDTSQAIHLGQNHIKDVKVGEKRTESNFDGIENEEVERERYHYRKTKLQNGLIEFYKTRHSKVFLSPLFNEKDTPLASFYIRPEMSILLLAKTRNVAKTSLKSLSAMFKTGNQANQEIHVIAEAGIGKTAFSNYLAITWCQAHFPDKDLSQSLEEDDIDCMQGFDFLFLVLLRDSKNICSVDDLIFEEVLLNLGLQEKPSEEFLLKILKNEKCLVILDGLDEWTHPEKECHRLPRSIPHRNGRDKCTILTTTRPWKLDVLNLNSCQIGKKVELSKLSYESAVTLTKRILQRLKSHPNEDALQRDVTAFISGIECRQNELTSVPLLLIYTICLWCYGVQIGNSKCDLYINIVELLLSRTIQKHGGLQELRDLSGSEIPECFAEYENCTKYYQLLMCLGKLAYNTLFNETRENTLVFDGSVAEKHLSTNEMRFTLHSGILSESTSEKSTKKFSKVSFSHKTVQEFFAAIFISSENEAQKNVLEKSRTVQDILDMSKMCEFISKMNVDQMCEISNDWIHVINEDEKTRDYRTRTVDEYMYNNALYSIQEMLMSCVEEMPESENVQLCLQDFFIDEDTEHSKQLQHLLKENKTNIKSLHINTRFTSSSLREIIDLFSLTDLGHIQKLYYSGDRRNGAEISRILFPSLQYVTLLFGEWKNDEENLSENLAQLHNLQYLYIDDFRLSHKTLETIFNFISGQISMKELKLVSLYCEEHNDHNDCKRLNLDLSQHSTLSTLVLGELPRLKLNVTTPSLVNVTLWGIHLDESSLLLSREMLNIERVELGEIKMSAGSLQNIIAVLEHLPQSVAVKIGRIKPETEYKRVRENILTSQTFHVIRYGNCWGKFMSKKQECWKRR